MYAHVQYIVKVLNIAYVHSYVCTQYVLLISINAISSKHMYIQMYSDTSYYNINVVINIHLYISSLKKSGKYVSRDYNKIFKVFKLVSYTTKLLSEKIFSVRVQNGHSQENFCCCMLMRIKRNYIFK